jgi:formylglycine-generating enzyme required for sulfatase activity
MKHISLMWLIMTMIAFPVYAGKKKVALVIGNADYSIDQGYLTNPINDASSVSERLEKLGFKVFYHPNLTDKEAMEVAVEAFSNHIGDAEVALFYYSGHGVQRHGKNYLMPTQAKINKASQIRHRAMNVEFLMDEMAVNHQGLSVIILDACRNDPYPRDSKSSGSRGLAKMDVNSGAIIAYSTKPGAVAADGVGRHSPYTAQLLKHLSEFPDQPIDDVLNKINVAVEDDTQKKQSPRLEMSPIRNVPCFGQCKDKVVNPDNHLKDSVTGSDIISVIPDRKKPNQVTDSYTGMEFVRIEHDCFQMGSPKSEAERGSDERQHRVCINQDYYLGKYEVTQAQWKKVMGDNPSRFKGDNKPVEKVSWNDVQVFIKKLNQKTGLKYRLPTEAEWEYAARAGTQTPFYTGRCINTQQANYDGHHDYNGCGAKTGLYREETVAVGSFQPNSWGLYDMAGNVYEWTCSVYDKDYGGAESQCKSNNHANNYRFVLRGGSWLGKPDYIRSAYRFRFPADLRNFDFIGFRLSRTVSF